jgi:anaphase-promoting complex subunit 1
MPVSVSLQGEYVSCAARFLSETTSQATTAHESGLLKSIHTALRGPGADLGSVHSSVVLSCGPSKETELSWNAHTVILSEGGILKKKWNFEGEAQAVQWACLGWLEEPIPITTGPCHRHSSDSDDDFPLPSAGLKQKSTFGPFSQVEQELKICGDGEPLVRTVFVFLRSIGKMFLYNGLEYTFGLPFIVRKAWPLHPHGVMIQRILDRCEMEDAEVTGDITLPTIFSITSPYSEPGAVGMTTGITGGFDNITASLEDEDENSTKPLKSVPATELVIAVKSRGPEAFNDDIVVTIEVDKRQLTVWRYAYVKPKDIPVPLGRQESKNATLTNQSSSFPVLPPALSTTATVSSLIHGTSQPSQFPGISKARRNSLTRNDLSMTMDRMLLGGRSENDTILVPIEHGRMKSAYWMEKLHSQHLSDIEYVLVAYHVFVQSNQFNSALSFRNVAVALFDHRFAGTKTRSLVAICFPASNTLSIFSLFYEDKAKLVPVMQTTAISIAALRVTRDVVYDLLCVKPDGHIALFTHGLRQLWIGVESIAPKIVLLQDAVHSSLTLVHEDGSKSRASFNLVPSDPLTLQTLHILASPLPPIEFFVLHRTFLEIWSAQGLRTSDGVEFQCLFASVSKIFNLEGSIQTSPQSTSWDAMSSSCSVIRFCDDPALRRLSLPPISKPNAIQPFSGTPRVYLGPVLWALHLLAEELRLQINHFQSVLRLAPLICRIACIIRPEWADYWKRRCPEALLDWPLQRTTSTCYH